MSGPGWAAPPPGDGPGYGQGYGHGQGYGYGYGYGPPPSPPGRPGLPGWGIALIALGSVLLVGVLMFGLMSMAVGLVLGGSDGPFDGAFDEDCTSVELARADQLLADPVLDDVPTGGRAVAAPYVRCLGDGTRAGQAYVVPDGVDLVLGRLAVSAGERGWQVRRRADDPDEVWSVMCLSRRLQDGTVAFADVTLEWSDDTVTHYTLELVTDVDDESWCDHSAGGFPEVGPF